MTPAPRGGRHRVFLPRVVLGVLLRPIAGRPPTTGGVVEDPPRNPRRDDPRDKPARSGSGRPAPRGAGGAASGRGRPAPRAGGGARSGGRSAGKPDLRGAG